MSEREYGWGSGPWIKFDGNYGREGHIEAREATCCGCAKVAPCVVIDASEGEYAAGAVCAKCIETLLANVQPPPSEGNS